MSENEGMRVPARTSQQGHLDFVEGGQNAEQMVKQPFLEDGEINDPIKSKVSAVDEITESWKAICVPLNSTDFGAADRDPRY